MNKFCVAMWLALIPAMIAPIHAAEGKKPNILFILSDDQRWDTIHALSGGQCRTPVQDRLVESGFHFKNAFCMGSMVGAVCLPSRTMIATGMSLWKIPKGSQPTTPEGVIVLPKLFNDAGYSTFHCGKAGNSCTFSNRTFTVNIETKARTADSITEHVDEAVKFLGRHDGTRPFLMYLAPPVPHDPRLAPPEYAKMYDPAKIQLPRSFMPTHPLDNGELKVRDEMLAAHPRAEAEMRRHLADYYATISHLDAQVGRLIDAVKQRGFLDNTIIVYSSDQGLACGGYHGLMGKQNLYEDVKPPLIVTGPGIPRGSSEALVYLMDLYPTFCEMAGIDVPPQAEGKSLLPVIQGKQPKVRDTLFGAYRACQRMIRDDRYKLMKYNANGVKNTQLFDLKTDPDEVNNLAGKPEFAAQQARLEKLLDEARKFHGDPTDFDGKGDGPAAPAAPKQSGKNKKKGKQANDE